MLPGGKHGPWQSVLSLRTHDGLEMDKTRGFTLISLHANSSVGKDSTPSIKETILLSA
jgi:hypothetical protein